MIKHFQTCCRSFSLFIIITFLSPLTFAQTVPYDANDTFNQNIEKAFYGSDALKDCVSNLQESESVVCSGSTHTSLLITGLVNSISYTQHCMPTEVGPYHSGSIMVRAKVWISHHPSGFSFDTEKCEFKREKRKRSFLGVHF